MGKNPNWLAYILCWKPGIKVLRNAILTKIWFFFSHHVIHLFQIRAEVSEMAINEFPKMFFFFFFFFLLLLSLLFFFFSTINSYHFYVIVYPKGSIIGWRKYSILFYSILLYSVWKTFECTFIYNNLKTNNLRQETSYFLDYNEFKHIRWKSCHPKVWCVLYLTTHDFWNTLIIAPGHFWIHFQLTMNTTYLYLGDTHVGLLCWLTKK